jgi:uncharacterized protein
MTYIALITGASSGIGAAAARRLAREPDVRLILVARREQRLAQLADQLPVRTTLIAADLTDPDTPGRIRDAVTTEHDGRLHMLLNNAGAAWRGGFADGGWDNVARNMAVNFEAPVRLTEALLPLLRQSAASRAEGDRRVCVVNVASTASRVARPDSGGYSAAKFALAGWTDSLRAEEAAHGIHVGTVLPGFVATEGFPAAELLAKRITRWMVCEPALVADAIVEAGPGGRAERYVPRYYWLFSALRLLAPALVRRAVAGGAFTTATRAPDD